MKWLRIIVEITTLISAATVTSLSASELSVRERQRVSVPEAHQAVAVDATSFYAIASRTIARYEKGTSKPLASWSAPVGSAILHLNSGVVVDGRLYCANSNWPVRPLKNSVEVFDAEALRHVESRTFSEAEGAINWIERHRGSWWIVFAFYGDAEVRRTKLVRYDDQWNQTGEWTFPEAVIQRFLPNSNSGGAFGPNGRLFVTGHDHAELYVLDVPADGGELSHVATIAAPIAGQGIAWDRSDIGTLLGIVRSRHEVVTMRLSHTDEYADLRRPVEWIRDKGNPVLPPRQGQFDATRCMNPWVIRDRDTYRLFYSGGDKNGKQRIGVATASITDVSNWTRTGPLFETGAAGSFDAQWCVLPHVVRMNHERWHLYYTGNAGLGSGLSAFPGMWLATSDDGITWTRHGNQPVLARSGEHGDPDAIGVAGGSVIQVPSAEGPPQWRFYYTGCPTTGEAHALNQQKTICLAVSADGIHWKKQGAVMLRDPDRDYEDIGVAGPVVQLEPDGMFRMWYSAIGTRHGFYSICYAESDDGIYWRRGSLPDANLQLSPTGTGWEQQMVEYPTIIREGDHLRMFYCGNGYGHSGIGTAITANGNVNQSAIDDVKSGKQTEAHAAWWGFDPADSTQSIQNAIDSGAKRVIIEDMGRPWIVTPLLAASDQELVFEKGAVLQAKKGEFKGSSDSLLSIINKNNVILTGYGASWRMHRDDYAKPPYKKAEWRHTLQIKSSSNVKVMGLTMTESGGDGIYLGIATVGVTNKNIQIVDVVLDKHYRQGISVITAEDLLIENTIMRNTAGTAPMAGIDFEPNHPSEKLVNCVLRNCVVEDNQGVGYAFYLPNLNATSQPISIRMENCTARGSNSLPVAYTSGEGEGHGPFMGSVTWVGCDLSGGRSPVVTLSRKPASGAQVRFENCRMKPGEGEPTTPAILFASSAGDQDDVGGVHFENCVIEDAQPRAVMGFHDGADDLRLIDVTGTLTIQTDDAKRELEITPQWLAELHPGNTFKRFPKYDFAKTKFVPLQPSVAEQNYPQKPFSQRRHGAFVLFANQGSDVRLSLRQSQVGSYSGKPIAVKAITPNEKQLSLGMVPFQSSATLEFVAPETGVYRIPIECDANQFQLLSTNCPTCISDTTARVWFISSVGELYFYVPAGTKEFGVKIFGEGMEGVSAAILNPQGTKVWEKATITTPEQFVGTGKADEGEVWSLRITKPATGAMEDYAVELQGIPPFLATLPTSLLRPAK